MNILVPTVIIGVMGVVFGIALAFASKAFSAPVDERAALIREALPGANCGVCGLAGCDAYAAAVVAGESAANKCAVGGQAVAVKIGSIMGIDAGVVEVKAARVKCAGAGGACGPKYEYVGIQSCAAARSVQEGPRACGYGCLGFGDCVKACKYNAIVVRGGVAEVIQSRCAACGMCASACPKKLIELLPVRVHHTVLCMNQDRGAVTRRNCTAGCIGCMRCTKVCSIKAISVTNNLASIDAAKCRQCGECVKVCPQKCVRYIYCQSASAAGAAQ